jgi:uncharacterized protein YycO
MKILLFHGRGIISWLIRFQTRGQYSHAAVMLRDGRVIEAWQGSGKHFWRNGGVRELPGLKEGKEGIDAFEIQDLNEEQETRLQTWLLDQVGTKYDYRGVIRFITRARKGDVKKLFCSELVFEGCLQVGITLLARTHSWEVPPDWLKRSTMLKSTGL